MRRDFFRRLPPATALLIVSSLQVRAIAMLPRATQTLPYHVLDVVAWPPLPTAPAVSNADFHELRRRQDSQTVCGYINGDSNLAATCSAGSHCVLDQQHNVVGCCANGQAECTAGVYTGCVDYNSGPQTVVNPYVFTCAGSDVCYKNQFGGGASQYGCGTASDLAATVDATASGITASVSMSNVDVSLTAEPTTVSTPITIDPSTGTRPFTSSSSSSSSSSTSSTSTSASSSTTSTSQPTTTPPTTTGTNSPSETGAAPAAGASSVDRTGAIVGGTISGVAVLVALIAVAVFLMRRKKKNVRKGPPGPGGDTQYISPMSGTQGFQRLHDSNAGFETGLPPGAMAAAAIPAGAAAGQPQQWPQQWQQQSQQWATDGNPQVGYVDNTGTVRYVENNPTVPQAGYVDVASPEAARTGFVSNEAMMAAGAAQYGGIAGAQPASYGTHGSMGNPGDITSPGRNSSIMPTPIQGYHYPGQFPAAYAAAALPTGSGAHKRNSSQGGVSSYYNSVVGPSSTVAGPTMNMRGGGGGSFRSSHPIASQFTYESWTTQQPQPPPPARENPELVDFSRGYNDALQQIGEEEPLKTSGNMNQPHLANQAGSTDENLAPRDTVTSRSSAHSVASSNGGRPLWHQNRTQPNRNQLWM
ncbi:hypothetical protein MGG_06116 [Pyricularia oryzae 70-15]|uniref:Mid2 domain-containing protein n=1 Tax=Pyricularia oryzae (strain 70-15 / ATCC MYA-4617 / FGSC 8958) TaxID=242507 RepID=G4N5I3_PYRO7|nr:uncharacterized protein MGG_06116 [Pyricularia oryzae 70-15]EHA52176.1 hypothetical protein MGG_06116 [Pyricularia oryzae 70-15]